MVRCRDERPRAGRRASTRQWLNDHSEYQRNFVHGLRNASGLHLQYHLAGDRVVTTWVPGEDHAGFPGVVHGGLIAAVLDDVMGRCSVLQRRWVVTGRMETRFREVAPHRSGAARRGVDDAVHAARDAGRVAHVAAGRHGRRRGDRHLPARARCACSPGWWARGRGSRSTPATSLMDGGTRRGRRTAEEREVKLAVGRRLRDPPTWLELDGVVATDRGEERLRAVYWDSDDLALCPRRRRAASSQRRVDVQGAVAARGRRAWCARRSSAARPATPSRRTLRAHVTQLDRRRRGCTPSPSWTPCATSVDVVDGDQQRRARPRPRDRPRRRPRRVDTSRRWRWSSPRPARSSPTASCELLRRRRRRGGHHPEVPARAARARASIRPRCRHEARRR